MTHVLYSALQCVAEAQKNTEDAEQEVRSRRPVPDPAEDNQPSPFPELVGLGLNAELNPDADWMEPFVIGSQGTDGLLGGNGQDAAAAEPFTDVASHDG